jgi:hypothetical protein
VDRPKPFMHVVSGEQIGYSGKLMQQAIFEAKQWRGSHDGGLGEDISYDSLTPCLNYVSLSSFSSQKRQHVLPWF